MSEKNRKLLSFFAVAIMGLTLASTAHAQRKDEPLSAEAVRKSIDKATHYLNSKQNRDGSWQKYRFPGDTTALCTLALLNAESDPKDPMIQKAIQHILAVPDDNLTTYVISLRIMVLAAADPRGEIYRRAVAKDVEWLTDMQVPPAKGKNAGGWSYGQSKTHGADASNSQFALLALHEASRMGVKIPQEHWLAAKEYWLNCFDRRTGGFCYTTGGGDVRGSMTCAGISSLIIIEENLADPRKEFSGSRANCCSEESGPEEIEKALAWMAKNFRVNRNPAGFNRGNDNQLYYLYGMERAGRLAGLRFFGPHDWYRDGAKQLVSQQQLSGVWSTRGHGESNPIVGTSLGLLFLAKGKRPVAIGKYLYPDGDVHPKGIHYLTRRLETQWKQKLNWQAVQSKTATVDDLLEAPVLFISGKNELKLSAEQKENLKKYLDNGGFLFAEACQGDGCGNSVEFDGAFRRLMAELFPDSQLETLDPGHPVWSAFYPLVPNAERPLLGLQSCCRTSVIYCPANLSCYWSLDRPAIWDIARDELLERIEYCGQLGTNVVSYATGRQLKDKLDTRKLADDTVETLGDRALEFPKLQHSGGSDDAPNAWRLVQRAAQESAGLRIKLDKKLIPPVFDVLSDYPFVFMHGRSEVSFNEQERADIKKYLELGGFLFVDSICSSPQFSDSFRAEILSIMGQPLTRIDPNHEIWTSRRFGDVIQQVTLRTRDVNAPGGFRPTPGPPELEGLELDGRLVVVFSQHDLSCALENTAVSQCDGYTHEDAIKIGTNVILYSLLSDAK